MKNPCTECLLHKQTIQILSEDCEAAIARVKYLEDASALNADNEKLHANIIDFLATQED